MAKGAKAAPAKTEKSSFPIVNLAVPVILGALCFVLLLQLADLTLADLGRHLKNGDVILHGSSADRHGVLHTNFYSYAQRDFPFINHHWLTGVVFYLVWKMSSFEGLTLLYASLVSAAVLIFYWIGQRNSSLVLAAPVAALVLPIITWRAEVRPEAFTYLLAAIFYFLLTKRDRGVYTIPILMILWVNLHIGFIFGFLILGAFCLKERFKTLLPVVALTAAAVLVNPSFLKGALYPFNIYGNYGFDVIENHSITAPPTGEGWQVQYGYFKVLLAVVAIVFIARWIWGGKNKEPRWPEMLLLGSVGVLSMSAVRHFPVFALLTIAIVPGLLQDIFESRGIAQARFLRFAAIAAGTVALVNCWQQFDGRLVKAGIGLKPNVNATADFLAANHVAGPIFNDFNNGGYLIFHRFPDRVFVDARAEAYPAAFFEMLTKMQADDATWQEADRKYRFNAIVFSLQYNSRPETERFMLARVHDPEWAPVFADDYSLIYLRRNDQNAAAIRAHELPKSMFR
ncbi:MAG: hypothetical protein LAO79_08955 [Acidobacteriia bacterium]|nr:hypothetical protein [Terriglobia bacterium]